MFSQEYKVCKIRFSCTSSYLFDIAVLSERDPKCDMSKMDIYGRSVMVAYFWDHEKIYEQTKDNTYV